MNDPRPAAASAGHTCPNCGSPVEERYCPRCGQRYADRLVSLRRMAAEFVDDQLSVNGTLPQTVGALLFRPGFLTSEYVAGRIVRYLPPFRLFLASTLAFFLVLSLVADPDILWRGVEDRGIDLSQVQVESAAGGERWNNVNFQIDSTRVPGWLMPAVERIQAQQDRMNSVPPRELLRAQVQAMIEAAAKVSFFLVPVFAALLMVLHLRRRRLYVEHFVFALHFHAAAFLLLTVGLVVGRVTFWWIVAALLALHLLLALKRVYAQSWGLTTMKLLALLVLYAGVLATGAGVASLVAVLLA